MAATSPRQVTGSTIASLSRSQAPSAACQHAYDRWTPMLAVYLLDEVFQMAQGGIQDVGAIVQFVVTRLTAKPPVVKQKVIPGRLSPTLA